MLTEKAITVSNTGDARKEKIEEQQAWEMLSKAANITIAKGKKTLQFSSAPANKDEIIKNALGRSGTLRAPTLKIGNEYVIGFNEEIYADLDR